MATIKLDRFAGQYPKIDRHNLPEPASVQSMNVDLRSGVLTPLRQPKVIKPFNPPGTRGIIWVDAKRVFPMIRDSDGLDYWVMFRARQSHLERSSVVNDQYDRIYFTERGAPPKYARESELALADNTGLPEIRQLGIPPGPTIVVTPSGGSGSDITRVYMATYYSDYGEEGSYGPAVTAIGKENGSWVVSGYPNSDPSGILRDLHGVSFYRASINTGLFYQIKQRAFGNTPPINFDDGVSETNLTTLLPANSQFYDMPPSNLVNLVAHPNGFFAGFAGRDIYFSEPFVPHAWPASNTIRLTYDIVELVVVGEAIVALTKGAPSIISGSSPETMSAQKFDTPMPCLTDRCAVVFQGGVYYPCPDGIARMDFGGPQLVTTRDVSREDWRKDWFTPDMIAVLWDGNYLAMTSAYSGFLYPLEAPAYGFTRFQTRLFYDGMDVGRHDGRVYLVRRGNIEEWMNEIGDTVNLGMRWSSKTFTFPRPINMGAFQIKRTEEIVTVEPDDPVTPLLIAYNDERYNTLLDVINGYAVNGQIALPSTPDMADPPVQPVGGEPLYETVEVFGDDIRMRIFADGNLMFEGLVKDEHTYRIQSGYKGTRWMFELLSAKTVTAIHIAGTPTELARV